jgi:rRNA maturation endonuclease Nob1
MKKKKTNAVVTFKLKCVGCGTIEDRPAAECREMQFCNKCNLPMLLEEVSIR